MEEHLLLEEIHRQLYQNIHLLEEEFERSRLANNSQKHIQKQSAAGKKKNVGKENIDTNAKTKKNTERYLSNESKEQQLWPKQSKKRKNPSETHRRSLKIKNCTDKLNHKTF